MKYLSLFFLLSMAAVQAGPYCHISHDEIDPVTTSSAKCDASGSAEDIQGFLDDFDFTITTAEQELTDAAEHAKKDSVYESLKSVGNGVLFYCAIKMHYAREWLTETWHSL